MLLYVDVKTFSERGFKSGSMKVILIQYRDFEGRLRVLKGWESSEKEVLGAFLSDLRRMKRDGFLMLVGHNVLRFDVPVLIRRMAANGLDSAENLEDFFHDVATVDTMQCMLPFNSMRFKGLSADDISASLGIPGRSNGDVEKLYREKRFAEIEARAAPDLDFVQSLYWKLKRGEIQADRSRTSSRRPFERRTSSRS